MKDESLAKSSSTVMLSAFFPAKQVRKLPNRFLSAAFLCLTKF